MITKVSASTVLFRPFFGISHAAVFAQIGVEGVQNPFSSESKQSLSARQSPEIRIFTVKVVVGRCQSPEIPCLHLRSQR